MYWEGPFKIHGGQNVNCVNSLTLLIPPTPAMITMITFVTPPLFILNKCIEYNQCRSFPIEIRRKQAVEAVGNLTDALASNLNSRFIRISPSAY